MTTTMERVTLESMTFPADAQDLEKFRNGRFSVALLTAYSRNLTDAGLGADWGMDADAMRRGAAMEAERKAMYEPMPAGKLTRLFLQAQKEVAAREAYLARRVVGVASGHLEPARKPVA